MTAALAQQFLAAAVDPSRWLGALGRLADETRSDHAQLIGIGADYAPRFNWVSDLDDGQIEAFAALETHAPRNNFRVAARLAAAEAPVLHEAHYAMAIPRLSSTDYVDLCRDWRISLGAQTDVRADAGGLIGVALLRSDTNGATDEAERATLAAARAPIATAIDLQIAIEHQGYDLVAGSFETMSAACFVLDAAMRVRATTPAAERLCVDGSVSVVDRRILFRHADSDRRLGSAMTAIASGALSDHFIAMDPGGAMNCRLHRLPDRGWSLGFAPFAVLVVRRVGTANPAGIGQLREMFGMTRAEAEVALRLAAGEHRDAICAARAISRETLRSHLRAIFAKMGVSRETQAIHMLHAMLG